MSEPIYLDKFGDEWIFIGGNTVKRLRDGNLGGWWNGKGLEIKV